MINKKRIVLFSCFLALTFSYLLVATKVDSVGINFFKLESPNVVQAASDSQGKSESITNDIESRGLVPCTLTECTFCHLLQLIERIFFWLLALAFAVAVFCIIVSGFAYILSVGDNSMMSWAKEGIKLSLIGFAICLLSWLAIHVLYTVLGYEGNWWKMECADEKQSTGSQENKNIANLYANEFPVDDLGGRNNPIALPDLDTIDLKELPENKYFFIHGIGGQPLESAAEQVKKIVAKAEENKTIVYAAVPYRDANDLVVGAQKINLNNYLNSVLNGLELKGVETMVPKDIQNLNDSSLTSQDVFYSLMLNMLTKNINDEIPLLITKNGITPADFNQIWPTIDWNKVLGSDSKTFKPLSSVVSGLLYKEGSGPTLYDPERYNGVIPNNNTHVDINLNPDGSLNLEDPIKIAKVAPGVTESELRAYTQQLGKVISSLQKQYQTQGQKGDFILGLTRLLAESQENYSKATTDSGGTSDSAQYENQEKLNTNQEGQPVYLDPAWNTGGAGILPVAMKVEANAPRKTIPNSTINSIEKELIDIFKNNGKTTSKLNNSGSTTKPTSGSNNAGTNNTGSPSSDKNNTNPPGNWSGTTLGLKGQLSRDEMKRLEEEIIPKNLKDLNLNVPVDFIMCLIEKESSFNPSAKNENARERSLGLMQLNAGAGTPGAALNGLKSYVDKNDPGNIYLKLRRDVGSDQVLISDAGLFSRRDPANERGITNVSLGIGYLKSINKGRYKRGNGLREGNYSDLDNLAAGYNGGPASRGTNTAYSKKVVNCTKTMQNRRNANGGKSPWLEDYDTQQEKRKKKK